MNQSKEEIICAKVKLAVQGIFAENKSFVCIICNKQILELETANLHIKSPSHTTRFKKISNSYEKINTKFSCKLCKNYIPSRWKKYLRHVHNEHNFEDPAAQEVKKESSQNCGVSYNTLYNNQIIEKEPEKLFCHPCKKVIKANLILAHIAEKKHKDFQKIRNDEYPTEQQPESECKKLVKNSVCILTSSMFHCHLCNCQISGLRNVTEHIFGSYHRNNRKEESKIDHQASCKEIKAKENQNQVHKLPKNMSQTSFAELISKNYLTKSSTKVEKYECNVCQCKIYGAKNIPSHVQSQRHSKLLDVKNIQLKSTAKINTVIIYPSRDKKPIEKSSANLGESFASLICKDFVTETSKIGHYRCNLCESKLSGAACVLQHVSGRRHMILKDQIRTKEQPSPRSESLNSCGSIENSSTSWQSYESSSKISKSFDNLLGSLESSENASNSWETTSIVSSYSALEKTTPQFEIPENIISLISQKLLEHRENEIYCIPCDAHLRDQRSLIEHTNSKHHVAKLNSYEVQNTMKNNKLPTTSKSNSVIINSSVDAIVSKLSKLMINETKNSRDIKSKLLEVAKVLLPIIEEHSLVQLKDEIYCPICNSHLQNLQTILMHVESKGHIKKLSSFRAQMKEQGCNPPAISNGSTITKLPVDVTSNKSKQPVKAVVEVESMTVKIPENSISSNSKRLLQDSSTQTPCEFGVCNKKTSQSLIDDAKPSCYNETLNDQLKNDENKLTTAEVKSTNLSENNSIGKQKDNIAMDSKPTKKSKKRKKSSNPDPMKQKKFQKQSAKSIRSRSFDPKYLKDNMQHIYKINKKKTKIIKLSCQLCFPKESDTLYCLICLKCISNNLQTFYEHICCSPHTTNLAKTERYDKQFINVPNEYSDLALAKEFMIENSEETIQCFSCDEIIENDNTIILKHIESDLHNMKKQPWKETMKKIEQDIFSQMEGTWYNIQKYWCQPCEIEVRAEFHFAEHLESQKHKNCIKKKDPNNDLQVYDSCTSCATLWLGLSSYIYTEHCQQPLHKYLVNSGDYSRCVLPNRAIDLLENAEMEVDSLINLSNKVLTVEKKKAESLLRCLEDTVRPEFLNAKAYPFGSRVSGLGFPDSDIDVYLDCGEFFHFTTKMK